jgi:hypothetical protein
MISKITVYQQKAAWVEPARPAARAITRPKWSLPFLRSEPPGYCRQYSNPTTNKISSHLGEPSVLTVRPTVFDRDVLALKPLQERIYERLVLLWRSAIKESNHRHRGLLRPRRQRPSDRRAAEQRDELTSPHM